MRTPLCYAGAVRADILNGSYQPAITDGSGRDRDTLRRALDLLEAAGYEFAGAELRSRASKQPLVFEILVTTKEQERIALAFSRQVKRAGITAKLRVVDAVQYDRRRISYDFDMIEYRWDQSLSPGNEQVLYFGSDGRTVQGTRNMPGIADPAVDHAIQSMLDAKTREEFVAADRVTNYLYMHPEDAGAAGLAPQPRLRLGAGQEGPHPHQHDRREQAGEARQHDRQRPQDRRVDARSGQPDARPLMERVPPEDGVMNDRNVDDADDRQYGTHAICLVPIVERRAQRKIAQEQEQQQSLEHDPWIAPFPIGSPRRTAPQRAGNQCAERERGADRRGTGRLGRRGNALLRHAQGTPGTAGS